MRLGVLLLVLLVREHGGRHRSQGVVNVLCRLLGKTAMQGGRSIGCQACLVLLALGCYLLRVNPLAINEEIASTNGCSQSSLPGLTAEVPESVDVLLLLWGEDFIDANLACVFLPAQPGFASENGQTFILSSKCHDNCTRPTACIALSACIRS